MSIRIRKNPQQEEPVPSLSDAPQRPSLAEEVRQRMAERRAGRSVGLESAAGGGNPFSLFGKGDLIVLLLLLVLAYFVVKAQYQLDLASWLWKKYLKPSYDDGWEL